MAFFDILLAIINVWLGRGFPLFVIAATITVTTIMMGIVLLPAALVSFVVARGVTRRIESLAAATSRLRGGDYDSRVAVTGEDEIAHLQIDFNAMAADLDRARRDLRAERDTVAALLRARQELIASVSHELRTPVATLRGYLESTRALGRRPTADAATGRGGDGARGDPPAGAHQRPLHALARRCRAVGVAVRAGRRRRAGPA